MIAAIRIRNRTAEATPIPRVTPSLWVVAELVPSVVVGVVESPSLFGIAVVVDMVADVSVIVVDAGALVKGVVVSPLVEISEIIILMNFYS